MIILLWLSLLIVVSIWLALNLPFLIKKTKLEIEKLKAERNND